MPLSKARHDLLRRLRSRHRRRGGGAFLVEGIRGATEAVKARADIRFAVISLRLAELDASGRLASLLEAAGTEVLAVDDDELAGLSGTVTPQGILLVCEEPKTTVDEILSGAEHGLLIADAIQDPTNLGGMIRTAAALELGGMVALDGTVDPWNAKVVRGSAGGCFHLPILRIGWDEIAESFSATDIHLLAAHPNGRDVAAVEPRGSWALAVGNEGAGLRAKILDSSEERVAVPIRSSADSLNASVAAAILMYEIRRRTGR